MEESDEGESPEHGVVVFSLDFELHWGVHDFASVADWEDRLLGARQAVPRLLDLMREYQIEATWATVGMLFARDREEMRTLSPSLRPSYQEPALSPYSVSVGTDEEDDPFHFAPSLIRRIAETPGQEVATHTFSHYYCLEPGQTEREFEADLKSAIEAGRKLGVRPESIVFPRNQANERYLNVLARNDITSYRGVERAWPYVAGSYEEMNTMGRRVGRLADTYAPVFGRTSFTRRDVRASEKDGVYNVPASVFIRSHLPSREKIEFLRKWRIESEIVRAAKQKEIVHLWTHPHNFGNNTDKNIEFIEEIFETIDEYRSKEGMVSKGMNKVVNKYV